MAFLLRPVTPVCGRLVSGATCLLREARGWAYTLMGTSTR